MMFTKAEVDFEHPAAGPHHCSQCEHFIRDQERCHIVSGHITAPDWCKKFDQKSKAKLLYGKRHP